MAWPWKRKNTTKEAVPDILREADFACRSGNAVKAVKLYKQVLRTEPENLSALVNLGAILSRDPKTLNESLLLMRKARRLDPQNPVVLLNLGTIQAQLGALKEAEECLEELAKNSPDYPDIHYNRAHIYLRQGRVRDAFLEAQAEVRLNPNSINAQLLQENLRKLMEGG